MTDDSRAAQADAALLQRAKTLLQQGRLDDAQDCCAPLLSRTPPEAQALHVAGLIALQKGQPAQAAELISRAIDAHPEAPAPHSNLGMALWAL